MGRHIGNHAGDTEAVYIGRDRVSPGIGFDPGAVGGDMDTGKAEYFSPQFYLLRLLGMRQWHGGRTK
jgi:hypothetical protein